MSDLGRLADRLEAIGDEIDQISFDHLRQLSETGATERPASDRELMKARRAVEKAVDVLRQLGETSRQA